MNHIICFAPDNEDDYPAMCEMIGAQTAVPYKEYMEGMMQAKEHFESTEGNVMEVYVLPLAALIQFLADFGLLNKKDKRESIAKAMASHFPQLESDLMEASARAGFYPSGCMPIR